PGDVSQRRVEKAVGPGRRDRRRLNYASGGSTGAGASDSRGASSLTSAALAVIHPNEQARSSASRKLSRRRLEMMQNRSAVSSASYAAECALLESHFSPATVTALANTVCPSAAPANVAAAKQAKGRHGLRFSSARLMAAFKNPRSKAALCPTKRARRQW